MERVQDYNFCVDFMPLLSWGPSVEKLGAFVLLQHASNAV